MSLALHSPLLGREIHRVTGEFWRTLTPPCAKVLILFSRRSRSLAPTHFRNSRLSSTRSLFCPSPLKDIRNNLLLKKKKENNAYAKVGVIIIIIIIIEILLQYFKQEASEVVIFTFGLKNEFDFKVF